MEKRNLIFNGAGRATSSPCLVRVAEVALLVLIIMGAIWGGR